MPIDSDELVQLAVEFLLGDKWQEATDLFRASMVLDPRSLNGILDRSLHMMKEGRVPDGDRLSDLAVEYDAKRSKAHYMLLTWKTDELVCQSLAKLCYFQEEVDAMEQFSRAGLALNPENPTCLAILAEAIGMQCGATEGDSWDELSSEAISRDPLNRIAIMSRLKRCVWAGLEESHVLNFELVDRATDENGEIAVNSQDYHVVSMHLDGVERIGALLEEASELCQTCLCAARDSRGWYGGAADELAEEALALFETIRDNRGRRKLLNELSIVAPDLFDAED